MTEVPKLRIPFEISGLRAVVIEQDSEEEIVQCVAALLRTPEGTRLEDPDIGIPDLTFSTSDRTEEIEEAIARNEPRAEVEVTDGDPIKVKLRS